MLFFGNRWSLHYESQYCNGLVLCDYLRTLRTSLCFHCIFLVEIVLNLIPHTTRGNFLTSEKVLLQHRATVWVLYNKHMTPPWAFNCTFCTLMKRCKWHISDITNIDIIGLNHRACNGVKFETHLQMTIHFLSLIFFINTSCTGMQSYD